MHRLCIVTPESCGRLVELQFIFDKYNKIIFTGLSLAVLL